MKKHFIYILKQHTLFTGYILKLIQLQKTILLLILQNRIQTTFFIFFKTIASLLIF